MNQHPDPNPAMPATATALAAMIDHTLLKPDATGADIERLCAEAVDFGFVAVCVNPVFVATARERLAGTDVRVCTVAGFPLGSNEAGTKADEAARAIDHGALEIDMVLFVGGMKEGRHEVVRNDVAGVASSCKARGALCKVILETCLLTPGEIETACRLCVEAGADFVKTSTGFSTGGAMADDVERMWRVVSPAGVRVKASGGIRTLDDALRMIAAGASRIGASSGVQIVRAMESRTSE